MGRVAGSAGILPATEREARIPLDTGKVLTPESSNIASFNYISARSVLIVEYKNKSGEVCVTWEYQGVPPVRYEDACNAESIGKFIHSRIVGYYEGRKIES